MPHSLPQALLIQAQTRGSQTALRYKQLGIWRTQSWVELARDVDRLAAALQLKGFSAADKLAIISEARAEALLLTLAAQTLGGRVILAEPDADNRRWLASLKPRYAVVQNPEGLVQLHDAAPGVVIILDKRGLHDTHHMHLIDYAALLNQAVTSSVRPVINEADCAFVCREAAGQPPDQLTHGDLLSGARQLVQAHGITERDEALAARVFAASGQARYLLAPWLVAGFCLNFPEALSTRDNDRRELGPTLVLGTRHSYERLELWARERLPLPGTIAHRLYHWAMAADPGVIRRKLGYWLIRRPLLDVLGMSRLSKPLLAGERLTPQSEAFFTALGIVPREVGAATRTAQQTDGAFADYRPPVRLGVSS